MQGYVRFLAERFKWAKTGAWGAVEFVALLAGIALALLVWSAPDWAQQHISERLNAFILGAIPLFAGASVFLIRWWFLSPYFIFKQTKTQLGVFQDAKMQNRIRERQRKYEECAKTLKTSPGPMLPFHALAHYDAYQLEEPEDLDWLCDELVKLGYGHPFEGMDNYVPRQDRKEFLRWVCLHPFYDPKSGMTFLQAAEKWREDHNYPMPPYNDVVAHDASVVAGEQIKPDL